MQCFFNLLLLQNASCLPSLHKQHAQPHPPLSTPAPWDRPTQNKHKTVKQTPHFESRSYPRATSPTGYGDAIISRHACLPCHAAPAAAPAPPLSRNIQNTNNNRCRAPILQTLKHKRLPPWRGGPLPSRRPPWRHPALLLCSTKHLQRDQWKTNTAVVHVRDNGPSTHVPCNRRLLSCLAPIPPCVLCNPSDMAEWEACRLRLAAGGARILR
ncbi:hypothetical protein EDC01DRAFT_120756 [Geopyxis carbonaria]|nr:hypothetical protein EDC01DRAFT_120756 [Geopyxis carbonaria]